MQVSGSQEDASLDTDSIEGHKVDEPMDVGLDEVMLLPRGKGEDEITKQYSSYFKYDQPEMLVLYIFERVKLSS